MLEPCPVCGALPCDWVNNPHTPPASQSGEPEWRFAKGLCQQFGTAKRCYDCLPMADSSGRCPSQSDEALVEAIAKTIAFETMKDMDPKAEPLTDEQWRDTSPEEADFLRGIARAILPILPRERAAAHADGFRSGFVQGRKSGLSVSKEEGRREGIEEAVTWLRSRGWIGVQLADTFIRALAEKQP